MASYIGIITRKDIPTGVTLRAKVVTPSGKKHGYQNFKTMVKATGISDLTACILDLNATTALLAEKGITSVTQNITSAMPSQGERGTSISYQFESIGSEDIKDYITDEGIIKKRPLYGENSVTGKMSINVSKGVETVSSKLDIVISSYTIDEIYANAQDLISWETIRARNAIESTDNSSGMKNVQYPLNLIKELTNVKGSSVPIIVEWAIVDSLQAIGQSMGVFTEPRITLATGSIIRPAYTDAYKLYTNPGAVNLGVAIVTGSVPLVRMGGITLTATLKVTNVQGTNKKIFMLSTLSKYLTNIEVSAWLNSNLKITLDDGTSYLPMNTDSNVINLIETDIKQDFTISIPKSASGFGPGTNLGLDRVNADVTVAITDFATTEQLKTYITAITNGPIADEDNGVSRITMNLAAAHSLSDADKKFCVRGSINVWSYSSDGLILGGEPSTSKAIWKFAMQVLVDKPTT